MNKQDMIFNSTLPPFSVVTDDQNLALCCEKASAKAYVMLDTEFVRTRTFYPKLGLIQLFDGEQVSLIDPQCIQDFSPFVALLKNPKVMKVLHACSEDLEVFLHEFKQLPEPMRDTQVMAQFLGFGNSAGLASLLKHYFSFEMDKGASRTDWLARPLTEKQLHYAAADVAYLWPLYEKLSATLATTCWQSATDYDCEKLVQKAKKAQSSEFLYLKIPNANKLEGVELLRLQALAQWRYEEAKKRNLALNFVVQGEHLFAVAKNDAKSNFDLLSLGLHSNEVRIHGKKILRILEQCRKAPQDSYPKPLESVHNIPGYKQLSKELRQKLTEIVPESLPADLLASKKRVDGLLKWYFLQNCSAENLPELLQNWRAPFGEALVKTLA